MQITKQYNKKNIEKNISNFSKMTREKYKVPDHFHFELKDRTWPGKKIETAPIWCEVGLRDWNQSIEKPMTVEQKLEYFNNLVNMWFKEIEVWFPSASQDDYNFVRLLIKQNLIPENVKIQILVPARKNLIEKTRESLEWAKNVIIHLYNSTSEVQRKVVFNKSKEEIINLAISWVKWIKESFSSFKWNIFFEYSPESFSWTEVKFAKEISKKVFEKWENFWNNPVILNLPATIENSTPDIYADKIEYFVREFSKLNIKVLISIHAHNDRWTAVATTELAVKAGADRIEWVILWNWERTWNLDFITFAWNLMTQWVSTNLDFSNIWKVAQIFSKIIDIPIHPRHPYIWKFVNLAFSGSHQDAIKKCFDYCKGKVWKWINAYLPFDPTDLGLKYEPIKINSQSWKWWVAYILDSFYWIKLNREQQIKMWKLVQEKNNTINRLLKNEELFEIYKNNF